MSQQFEGRLIFPGGRRELKTFKKEMKKLRSNWVADVNWKYRKRIRFTANQWADLADDAVDILIGSSTSAVLAFIAGLEHHEVQEDVYSYVKDASRVMAEHRAALYEPGGTGTRDPADFEAEAEEILAKYNPSPQSPVRHKSEKDVQDERPDPPEKPDPTVDAPVDNAFCTACGSKFQEADRFCGRCGKARNEQ